jgi:hypothetical protein
VPVVLLPPWRQRQRHPSCHRRLLLNTVLLDSHHLHPLLLLLLLMRMVVLLEDASLVLLLLLWQKILTMTNLVLLMLLLMLMLHLLFPLEELVLAMLLLLRLLPHLVLPNPVHLMEAANSLLWTAFIAPSGVVGTQVMIPLLVSWLCCFTTLTTVVPGSALPAARPAPSPAVRTTSASAVHSAASVSSNFDGAGDDSMLDLRSLLAE